MNLSIYRQVGGLGSGGGFFNYVSPCMNLSPPKGMSLVLLHGFGFPYKKINAQASINQTGK